jgi:hypothetical protein
VGQLGEMGEYWMGMIGRDLIWNSELQGGSPCLCQLRPMLVDPIEQAFECTDASGTYGIPKLNSFMCQWVGWYLTSLHGCTMGSCSGHQQCVHQGIHVEDGTRARWDPARVLGLIMNSCHSWCPPGLRVLCYQVYNITRLTIDFNLCDTLGHGWWLVHYV